ncbi:MAG: hypothetical protein RL204_11 [Bacteroidota bacterium]|jgi:hypothetical protein
MKRLSLLFITISLLSSCGILLRKNQATPPTVDVGVCKKMKGEVLVYAVFTESKQLPQWTGFDMHSTKDSLKRALGWLENKARENGQSVHFKTIWHKEDKIKPIESNLPNQNMKNLVFKPSFIPQIDRWSNKVSKQIIRDLPIDTVKTIIKRIEEREKLVSRLRQIYNVENIALLFFVNNHSRSDASVTIHTGDNKSPEYCVITEKRASVIAHEILHLFGAIDFYLHPGMMKFRQRKHVFQANKEFKDDIMAYPSRDINQLDIEDLTAYLIGWRDDYDFKFRRLLYGR